MSTEQKHTPEPWSADRFGNIYGANGELVRQQTDCESDIWHNEAGDVPRIVACVNACIGLSPEELEGAPAQRQALVDDANMLRHMRKNAPPEGITVQWLPKPAGSSAAAPDLRIVFGVISEQQLNEVLDALRQLLGAFGPVDVPLVSAFWERAWDDSQNSDEGPARPTAYYQRQAVDGALAVLAKHGGAK